MNGILCCRYIKRREDRSVFRNSLLSFSLIVGEGNHGVEPVKFSGADKGRTRTRLIDIYPNPGQTTPKKKQRQMSYAVCFRLYLKTYAIQPRCVSPHYSVLKSLVDKIPFSSPIGRPFRYFSGSVSKFPSPTSRHGLVALRRDLWLQKGLLVSSIDIR